MTGGESHGPSPIAAGIGVALIIIFLTGPADSTIRLAVAAGLAAWFAKGGWSGGH